MKEASLVFIVDEDAGKVLLGRKKTGEIGIGTLNGPGGKREKGETLLACAVREMQEEVEVTLDPDHLVLVAVITFFAAGAADFKVFVYRTSVWSGEPQETAHMAPGWYDLNNLPFEEMLEGDRAWVEIVLKVGPDRVLGARVYSKERAKEFERVEFYPLP